MNVADQSIDQRKDPAVDAWFEKSSNPQKDLMRLVRQTILDADERITECIKWSTPTFAYKGNLTSIQPQAKNFVSLMFHRGSEIPSVQQYLEGDAALLRTMKFVDGADLEKRRSDLQAVVRAWCDWKSTT